jgi:hypothetical protein
LSLTGCNDSAQLRFKLSGGIVRRVHGVRPLSRSVKMIDFYFFLIFAYALPEFQHSVSSFNFDFCSFSIFYFFK